ncbi:WD40 repeat domain-containing protein (plasmid) [Skermanella mucosa]|uniref:WD40 repeat domain-containing protein n=1 Tax=Skermanella mucosa TaxID=1789672 RepID=UPI00192BE88F|nr:WD40 repeat domain-containing protein [Skermanella mucosa]UEM25251.1 WD40 repeat domain-containing protein [Skermanella mucosa]
MSPVPERRWETGAWVVGLAVNRAGTHAAAALGDGSVRLLDLADPDGGPRASQVHAGACLTIVPDLDDRGFLTGGDDGRLCRIVPGSSGDAAAEPLAEVKGRWIEHVDAEPQAGLRAFAAGRQVTLLDRAGRPACDPLDHPSTVGGLAFAPKGKRLAVAHYGGVSLWWTKAPDVPTRLDWKGSHLGVIWHPAGTHVMTAMQEAELHGWRLKDKAHMRMSGYAAKVRSFAWAARGRWLATAGAEEVVCWPFFGGGPWDKAPLELPGPGSAVITAVAPHPMDPVLAAGRDDGMIFVAPLDGSAPLPLAGRGGSAVSALAWTANGRSLLAGTEDGRLSWITPAR